MFTDAVLSILCLYSLAMLITSLLMIATTPKDNEEKRKQSITEYTMFALASIATFFVSFYTL
ncbi:hypothetical protein HUZ36_06190 [Pseudoalteromonas sp. McH1-7]|uniref:Uncharacterized protein n=1 Tax=Pseudoalteromonas peptidolytica F12-50-A1 TaxID=1315280 RepID=A0A8I0MUQ2_9GAMM|nr:hypothetical protein [Pseudoalteromonas sp. J010]MBE0346190.1 hypothetical protein [Pseudoalteromonas peptidolytica F12-50-A1]NLR16183.1 hypothetical protein [Pseudoalteromonas peptidolytica]NUZ10367.1 hypothetical protein [Pseudoalteromonas sp. McH1-7]USD27181.1 hypothetical protein J8Z24_09285 [Pseudoalteromonas sp. SCSIO 43201]RRS07083.1 hypothetical protein EAG18_18920 [Pseudoalteromonas sp. J010]